MVNTLGQEGGAIVLGFIESDDFRHVQVLKDVDVAGSCVAITMHRVTLIDRSHEGQELVGDDPVKISVLNLFVVFVFPRVERLKIVPSEPDRVFEPLQTM